MRLRTPLAVRLMAAFLAGVGCGDADPYNTPSVAETAPDEDRVEAVVVDSFRDPDRPAQWLLVDLAGGATLDGAFRLGVEAPNAEVSCGQADRPITTPLFARGDTVTFEPV
jgi:hypothetical protein